MYGELICCYFYLSITIGGPGPPGPSPSYGPGKQVDEMSSYLLIFLITKHQGIVSKESLRYLIFASKAPIICINQIIKCKFSPPPLPSTYISDLQLRTDFRFYWYDN